MNFPGSNIHLRGPLAALLIAMSVGLMACPHPDIELEDPTKIAGGGSPVLANSNHTKAREHFLAGNKAMRDKKWPKAIKRFTKALELDPKFSDAYENRGVARMYRRLFYPALEDFAELLELEPKRASAYYNLGNVYATQAMFDPAIKAFKKSLELEAKQPGALNNLGNAYAGAKQLELALQTFEEFTRRYKDSPEGFNNLGIVYELKKDKSRAEEMYRRAIQVDPKHHHAYLNLAELCRKQKRTNEAITFYEGYLKFAPKGRDTDWSKVDSVLHGLKAKAGRF